MGWIAVYLALISAFVAQWISVSDIEPADHPVALVVTGSPLSAGAVALLIGWVLA